MDSLDKITFNEVLVRELENKKTAIILYCLDELTANLLIRYLDENIFEVEIYKNIYQEVIVDLKMLGKLWHFNTQLTTEQYPLFDMIIEHYPDLIGVGYKPSASRYRSNDQYKELRRP